MLYWLCPQAEEIRLFMEPHSRSRVPYRTAKEMRILYSNGNFVIIVEIGSFARPPTDGDKLLTGDGQAIPVLPRGSLKRPFEWFAGYVAVDKNTYLAVIGNPLSSLLRR